MKQFTITLNENMQRPVFFLEFWHNVSALLDTGAVCPVWTKSEALLQQLGGKAVSKKIPISGFGGIEYGNAYELPELQVGNLIYPSFKIVACLMPDVPYQIILPATMFSNLIYEIDDKNHKLNVTIPSDESNIRNMVIKDNKGRFHVFCHSGTE